MLAEFFLPTKSFSEMVVSAGRSTGCDVLGNILPSINPHTMEPSF